MAQRMLDFIDGRPVAEDVELPFFFVERESVRRVGSQDVVRQSFAGMA